MPNEHLVRVVREVLTSKQLAESLGVSTWAVYKSVKRRDCPVPPTRVGRRVVFARVPADQLLGVEDPS